MQEKPDTERLAVDYDEQLAERSGVSDVPRVCRNCGHEENEHVDGTCADNGPSQIGEDGWGNPEYELCGCRVFDPMTREDYESELWPEEI
jgi:hypothetical protein